MSVESLIIRGRAAVRDLAAELDRAAQSSERLERSSARVSDNLTDAAEAGSGHALEVGGPDPRAVKAIARAYGISEEEARSQWGQWSSARAYGGAPGGRRDAGFSPLSLIGGLAGGVSGVFKTILAGLGIGGVGAIASTGTQQVMGSAYALDRALRAADGLSGNIASLKEATSAAAGIARMSVSEMASLVEQLTKTSGSIDALTAVSETSLGAITSRQLGLQEGAVPQWLAEMRFRGEGSAQELIPVLTAAIARAQLPGRGEEVMRQLLSYTERMSGVIADAADVVGYANTLAEINRYAAPENANLPGLRGEGAVRALSAFDAAVGNVGSDAQEIFWYRFFAEQGITNPREQMLLRERGITQDPAQLSRFYNLVSRIAGPKPEDQAAHANYMVPGLSRNMHLALSGFAARPGGVGNIRQYQDWLREYGMGFENVNPASAMDLAQLYQLTTAGRSNEDESFRGLVSRYLSVEERNKIGDNAPVEDWTRALVEKMKAGGTDTYADTLRDVRATAANIADKTVEGGLLGTAKATQEAINAVKSATEGTEQNTGGILNYLREKWNEFRYPDAAVPGYPGSGGGSSGSGGSRGTIPPAPMPGPQSFNIPKGADAWMQPVGDMARRYKISPAVLAALIEQESHWDPTQVSRKGARGLTQLMPGTARRFKVNMADPIDQIRGGAEYLAWLMDHFGGDVNLALAGYNAGEGAVERYGNRIPPYAETLSYVPEVKQKAEKYRRLFADTERRVAGAMGGWTGENAGTIREELRAFGERLMPSLPQFGAYAMLDQLAEARQTMEVVVRNGMGDELGRAARELIMGRSVLMPPHLVAARHGGSEG